MSTFSTAHTTAHTTAMPISTPLNATYAGFQYPSASTPNPWTPYEGPKGIVGITLPMALVGLSILAVFGGFVWGRYFMKKMPKYGMEVDQEKGMKEEEKEVREVVFADLRSQMVLWVVIRV
jgi:hypothetical protein